MYCAATAADCPFVAMKEKLVKMAAKKQCKELNAQLDAAQKSTGTAAQTTCTVLPLLLTALLLPRRKSLSRWLPRSNVKELNAQLDVAQKSTGTAAQTTCTVLPLLLTAPLLP